LFVALIIPRSFALPRTTGGKGGEGESVRYYVLYYIIDTVVNEAIDRLLSSRTAVELSIDFPTISLVLCRSLIN